MKTYKEYTNSSWVKSIGYDPERQTMTVEPKNGHLIHYEECEPALFEAALNADSIGKFIHHVIKPLYQKQPEEGE